MSKELDHMIIKTLDNPPRLLFWTVDEFLLMAVPPFVGIAIGQPLLILASFLVKPIYSRFRRKSPKGTMKHKLYWHFPKGVFNRAKTLTRLPPSHIREYLL